MAKGTAEMRGEMGEAEHPEPSATEAVGHLRAAATELIAAARAVLDLVEQVVDDDDALASAAETMTSLTKAASRAARDASGYGSPRPAAPDPPDDGVQHIRIS